MRSQIANWIIFLVALLVSTTGCATWSLPKSWKLAQATSRAPRQPTEDEVPRRLIQTAFTPAETAQMSLAAASELDAGGHTREAMNQYERARQLDPSLAGLSWRIAILASRLGDLAKADREFQAASDTYPDNADLLNDYGYFLLQSGRFDQAEQCLRQSLALDPQHAQAISNLGILLARQGRLQESFEIFSATVGPAAAHSDIGVILAQQGKTAAARESFRLALTISPELKQARGMLVHVAQHSVPTVSNMKESAWR